MSEIEYLEESKAEYGEQAAATWTYDYVPASDPDHIAFDGRCPACGHDSPYDHPLTVLRQDVAPEGADSIELAAPAPILVRCQCGVAHPKADGETGCGRYWTLTVAAP